jgi:hypothetical protein
MAELRKYIVTVEIEVTDRFPQLAETRVLEAIWDLVDMDHRYKMSVQLGNLEQ